MDKAMLEILTAREQRAEKQRELLKICGHTLICLTMNIPGNQKNTPLIRLAFETGQREIEKTVPTAPLWTAYTAAGPECFYGSSLAPQVVKDAMVALETAAPVGRLWDIDVIAPDGAKLSRPVPRKCLVCEKTFLECAREQKHTLQEVLNTVNPILKDNAAKELAQLAVEALLEEVRLTPKPGLVDADNSGAHTDMDLALFEKSAECLRGYFEQAVQIGMANEDCMAELQAAGVAAEETMFKVTGGINTHKGAIYSFGLILGAIGAHLAFGSEIFSTAALLASDGKVSEEETHGNVVRKKFRRCGARAEAIEGFPNAISAFNILQETNNPHRALLWLMSSVPDTNLLYRGGADGLIFVQEWAKKVQAYPDDKLIDGLRTMNEELVKQKLSPGGSADLLALGIFLLKTEDIWND